MYSKGSGQLFCLLHRWPKFNSLHEQISVQNKILLPFVHQTFFFEISNLSNHLPFKKKLMFLLI